jgi:hypothetical protein
MAPKLKKYFFTPQQILKNLALAGLFYAFTQRLFSRFFCFPLDLFKRLRFQGQAQQGFAGAIFKKPLFSTKFIVIKNFFFNSIKILKND